MSQTLTLNLRMRVAAGRRAAVTLCYIVWNRARNQMVVATPEQRCCRWRSVTSPTKSAMSSSSCCVRACH
ncbi:hypothetical protein NOCARDAX2BIS_260006 [Nocardioides sp. AX2bis]|nr:hypothetical protein NOCARDAX2BIS_260006 [Nocardioides sp. AX2bis]